MFKELFPLKNQNELKCRGGVVELFLNKVPIYVVGGKKVCER